MGSGSFGERDAIVKYRNFSAVRCATTAEPIDLPFASSTPVGTRSVVFARWRPCALMGGHIGATWRIRLKRPRAAAMLPYVKLL